MIQAVIFDMDGIIIDSEPLWDRTYMHVLKLVGLNLTEDMCRKATGYSVKKNIDYWYQNYPWKYVSKKQVEETIWEYITLLVNKEGKLKEGVKDTLEFLKKHHIKIGLASTSPISFIHFILDKLDIKEYFEVIHSGEFEEYHKPHPAVYLTTAKRLNVKPRECLAIEDSIPGIISAKAANMICVAIPSQKIVNAKDKRIAIADIILPCLSEFDNQTWNQIGKYLQN